MTVVVVVTIVLVVVGVVTDCSTVMVMVAV